MKKIFVGLVVFTAATVTATALSYGTCKCLDAIDEKIRLKRYERNNKRILRKLSEMKHAKELNTNN